MARVFKEKGFTGEVWPGDHAPPHVHVFKAGREAKIALGSPQEGPYLLDPYNMKARDIRQAMQLVQKHRDAALAKWEEFHGQD